MNKKLFLVFLLLINLLVIAFVKCDDEVAEENDSDDDDSARAPSIPEEDDVLVLSKSNFDDVVSTHAIILVEFYAPWCGHCKSLAPEYAAAAKRLKKEQPAVPLAKVDATVETELAQRFDVTGYPTLKFFKDGQPLDYDGGRTEEEIFSYLKERSDPNWQPPPGTVVVLTKDNFTDFVSADLTLVEFYAPWCGHCKRIAPDYEKASQALLENDPPIKLAKVDATVETELATKYEVTGYPTIKVFRKGKAFEYKGGRDKYGFISYMKNQVGDASKTKPDVKSLKGSFKEDDVTVVGYFESADSPLYIAYLDAGNNMREDYTFLHTFNKETWKSMKVDQESVVVYIAERFHTKHEHASHALTEPAATAAEVEEFIKKHDIPLVGEYTHSTQKSRYDSARRPLVLVFYTVDWTFDHRKNTQMWRKKVAAIAKDFPTLTFAIADEDSQAQIAKEFGFDESSEEINIGIIDDKDKKYPMKEMEEFDSDDVRDFLKKYTKGSLKPRVKSQPIPKRSTGPVTVVVGDNFQKVVLDPTKDVLLEMYAPWCGHCKKLEPIYNKLAKSFKHNKDLVIAKFDATANDAPAPFAADGFPTIYFVPRDKKDSPIKFEGGNRELEDFEEFIRKHATVSIAKRDEL